MAYTTISKNLAFDVAKQMVAPMKTTKENVEKELSEYAYSILLKKIPKEILEASQDSKLKKYFKFSGYAGFKGERDTVEVTLKKDHNYPSGGWKDYFECSEDEIKKMLDLDNKANTIKKEIEQSVNEIVVMLMSLKSYSKIKKEFPEAYAHIVDMGYENKECTAVALDVSKIMQKINLYGLNVTKENKA